MPLKKDVLLPDAVRGYLKDHKTPEGLTLDEAVIAALNNVLRDLPDDPFGHVAEDLAKHCWSAPRLVALRRDGASPRPELRFNVLANVRGARVCVHSFSLKGVLFPSFEFPGSSRLESKDVAETKAAAPEPKAKADPKGKKGAKDAPEPVVEDPPDLVPSKEELAHLDKFATFLEDFFERQFRHKSVENFLTFHGLCADLAEAPPPAEGVELDMQGATARMVDELLLAVAHSLNLSCLEFFQQLLRQASNADPSPPLCSPEDLSSWRRRWPGVAMPVVHGGGPSVIKPHNFRVLVCFSPFAMVPPLEDGSDSNNCPPVGWVQAAVGGCRATGAGIVKILQADKALAALVDNNKAYAHPEGLVKTIQMAKTCAEAVAGEANAAELSGVLWACAEEAWLEEQQVYEIEAEKNITLEELVDLYAELLDEETGVGDWLQMIVRPFRPEDMSIGCELLHARRPALRLIADYGDEHLPRAMKGAAYGCAWHLSGSSAAALSQYAERNVTWKEAGGCAKCAVLGPTAALQLPSAMDIVLACREAEVLCLDPDVDDAAVSRISVRTDEVLHRLTCPDDPADL